jgi:predicted phage tail protein
MRQGNPVHAETVHLLVNKAKLEPDIAVAFAEAIDMAVANAQLVTTPVLDSRFEASNAKVNAQFAAFEAKMDARFAALEAKMDARFDAFRAEVNAQIEHSSAVFRVEIERCKSDLVRWVFLVMLGNVALSVGANALLNAIQHAH